MQERGDGMLLEGALKPSRDCSSLKNRNLYFLVLSVIPTTGIVSDFVMARAGEAIFHSICCVSGQGIKHCLQFFLFSFPCRPPENC